MLIKVEARSAHAINIGNTAGFASKAGRKEGRLMEEAHSVYPREADDLTPSPLYRTFVIRCWLEGRGQAAWRFSLLEVGSPLPRRGFARLDDLVAFLQSGMDAAEADRRAGVDRLVEVFQRATNDTAYRQAFTRDPVRVLSEAGLQVPEGITYEVVENTPERVHIVLPPLAPEGELGGEVLEARATKSALLCAAGPGRAGLIALMPGCTLGS
jgi:hypothetical protein